MALFTAHAPDGAFVRCAVISALRQMDTEGGTPRIAHLFRERKGDLFMYHIAIIDDEQVFIQHHEMLLHEILHEENIPHTVRSFCSQAAFEDAIQDHKEHFDLLLLDILLANDNGIALAKRHRDRGAVSDIIFCTCAREFALDGYSVYPIQFLLKPVTKTSLQEAVLRAYASRKQLRQLTIRHKEGITLVPVDNISYVEALNRNVVVHTTERDLVLTYPLKTVVDTLLPAAVFVQCHKSFVVPIEKIQDVRRQELQLKDQTVIPIGRAFYRETLKRFVDFM